MEKTNKSPAQNMRQAIKSQNPVKNIKSKKLDRTLLPSPVDYYSQQFPKLPRYSQWVTVHCCFHEDRNPSLRLNLVTGASRCFGCHAKGGDVIAFHMKHYSLNFITTINHFGAWCYE
jgi:hypothetical protein